MQWYKYMGSYILYLVFAVTFFNWYILQFGGAGEILYNIAVECLISAFLGFPKQDICHSNVYSLNL